MPLVARRSSPCRVLASLDLSALSPGLCVSALVLRLGATPPQATEPPGASHATPQPGAPTHSRTHSSLPPRDAPATRPHCLVALVVAYAAYDGAEWLLREVFGDAAAGGRREGAVARSFRGLGYRVALGAAPEAVQAALAAAGEGYEAAFPREVAALPPALRALLRPVAGGRSAEGSTSEEITSSGTTADTGSTDTSSSDGDGDGGLPAARALDVLRHAASPSPSRLPAPAAAPVAAPVLLPEKAELADLDDLDPEDSVSFSLVRRARPPRGLVGLAAAPAAAEAPRLGPGAAQPLQPSGAPGPGRSSQGGGSGERCSAGGQEARAAPAAALGGGGAAPPRPLRPRFSGAGTLAPGPVQGRSSAPGTAPAGAAPPGRRSEPGRGPAAGQPVSAAALLLHTGTSPFMDTVAAARVLAQARHAVSASGVPEPGSKPFARRGGPAAPPSGSERRSGVAGGGAIGAPAARPSGAGLRTPPVEERQEGGGAAVAAAGPEVGRAAEREAAAMSAAAALSGTAAGPGRGVSAPGTPPRATAPGATQALAESALMGGTAVRMPPQLQALPQWPLGPLGADGALPLMVAAQRRASAPGRSGPDPPPPQPVLTPLPPAAGEPVGNTAAASRAAGLSRHRSLRRSSSGGGGGQAQPNAGAAAASHRTGPEPVVPAGATTAAAPVSLVAASHSAAPRVQGLPNTAPAATTAPEPAQTLASDPALAAVRAFAVASVAIPPAAPPRLRPLDSLARGAAAGGLPAAARLYRRSRQWRARHGYVRSRSRSRSSSYGASLGSSELEASPGEWSSPQRSPWRSPTRSGHRHRQRRGSEAARSGACGCCCCCRCCGRGRGTEPSPRGGGPRAAAGEHDCYAVSPRESMSVRGLCGTQAARGCKELVSSIPHLNRSHTALKLVPPPLPPIPQGLLHRRRPSLPTTQPRMPRGSRSRQRCRQPRLGLAV
jgi:hypothetical protein